jgi:ADP-L-glycero-D-manno-heptose 6-epimerase
MDRNAVIAVTGSAGFIGSYLAGYLNRKGYDNLVLVDAFDDAEKEANYSAKKIAARVERGEFFDRIRSGQLPVDFVFHLGARTDTTEFDYAVHERWNVEYSKKVWACCAEKNIPLVYASSAATYGAGEEGYSDDHSLPGRLVPLNPYGISKNEFDKWALKQDKRPPFWAGLKFFNVYGPNEYHKQRMASVVFHAFNQIRQSGQVKLFRSHNPQYRDGEQLRDFIYVHDVARIMFWMMEQLDKKPIASGLYNVGTGQARTFRDLVTVLFQAMNLPVNIAYIDTPMDIRKKYQYFTEADMHKLRDAGYSTPFFSLEEGVMDYAQHFLIDHRYY